MTKGSVLQSCNDKSRDQMLDTCLTGPNI